MNDLEQSELDEAAIAFFRAIRAVGKKCHGHDQFGFRVDIQTMSPKNEKTAALKFGADIQTAITAATRAVQPVTIEGTTLQ